MARETPLDLRSSFLSQLVSDTRGRPCFQCRVNAFARFGKGRRHTAQLNMGDSFAYACARHYGQQLLFKGSDFSKTDIEQA
jgi:uncharacterized protein with PIN domain